MLLGCTFHIVGACINSTADVRCWKNLPGELLVVPMVLPEGGRTITVRGYMHRDNVVRTVKTVTVGPNAVATAHLSLMPYPTFVDPSTEIIQDGVAVSNGALAPISSLLPAEITPIEKGEQK